MSLEKLYIKQKRVIIERKNIESVHCRRRWTHGVVSTLHLIKTTDCFITTRESFYSCSDALPTAPGFPAVAGLPAFDRQNDAILHDCSRPKTKKIKNLISLHSFRSSCSRSKRHCFGPLQAIRSPAHRLTNWPTWHLMQSRPHLSSQLQMI